MVLPDVGFVLKKGEGFLNVIWHEQMHMVVGIIPPQMDADVRGSSSKRGVQS